VDGHLGHLGAEEVHVLAGLPRVADLALFGELGDGECGEHLRDRAEREDRVLAVADAACAVGQVV
jgi:hypothetical protein